MSKKSIFTIIAIFLVFSLLSAVFGVLFAKKFANDGSLNNSILGDIIVRDKVPVDANKITFAEGEIKVSSTVFQGSQKLVFICDTLKPNTYYDIKWSLDTDYDKDVFNIFSYKKLNGEEEYFIMYSNDINDDINDDFLMKTYSQINLVFEDEFTFRSNSEGKFVVIFGSFKNYGENINSALMDFIGLIDYIEIEEVK